MPTTPKDKAPNLREPWVFVPGLSRKLEFSIFGADGSELVQSVQTTKADGFTVADVAAIGQMMSAAPDLYDALKDFVAWHGAAHDIECPEDDTCRCLGKALNDKVNEAIRKAEGRQ